MHEGPCPSAQASWLPWAVEPLELFSQENSLPGDSAFLLSSRCLLNDITGQTQACEDLTLIVRDLTKPFPRVPLHSSHHLLGPIVKALC